ncbi:universal stress protein [Serratia fonticola]|uniref:universal stress protein n=1 Tax=Serratia fonticola TaxID=47917 RepID=UPI00217B29E7|nr:universal stress protein [Serratia fonticola]CAI0728463.1 Universal stress protein A [Serratia fonticola]CAI0729949.1 Universal stress protein A [Serratia fonticola]
MTYQHIAIATDLSDDAELLVRKGSELAGALQAKLSLIYIDEQANHYSEFGSGEFNYTDKTFTERVKNMLNAIQQQAEYPISEVIIGRGELCEALNNAISEKGIELVIFGHHHDMWSRLVSSTRRTINHIAVDMLVVPIEKH